MNKIQNRKKTDNIINKGFFVNPNLPFKIPANTTSLWNSIVVLCQNRSVDDKRKIKFLIFCCVLKIQLRNKLKL